MGIKGLWSVLQPYCESKPLYELEGKIVAIDLAGWVCESLCVVDYEIQPRFYLRNLFFRTCFLLLSGVTPVFVLEGDAPPLKYGVICQRNALQFRGAKPRNNDKNELTKKVKKTTQGRSRFNFVLRQCEDLIASMGIQCIQGPGEAEAFCSYLNHDKMVDGVISQDSDCFAYGAKKVYRNFSVSKQGQSAAQGGSVDVYDLDKVCQQMDFGQNKIIVMALLCGCDYCPDGIHGIGKDAVMKFIQFHSEHEVLDRIKSWRSNDSKYKSLESKVENKRICVNCGHLGRLQSHNKTGCDPCNQTKGCNSSLWKEKRAVIKFELQIRKKALQYDDFPNQSIIDEYINRPINLPKLDLTWKQPNLVKFVKFMSKLLQWDEIYSFQKFLPLLTRWQIFHFSNNKKDNAKCIGSVVPDFIKKKRAPKGVASYEIVWKDNEGCFDGLIPHEQFQTYLEQTPMGLENLWSTIEPEDLVQKAYPELVSVFLESKKKKPTKKSTKSTKSTKTNSQNLSNDNLVDNIENIPKKKKASKMPGDKENKLKTRKTTTASIKSQDIQQFFKKVKKPLKVTAYQSPTIKTGSQPLNLSNISLNFGDNDADLSDIIQGIIQKTPELTAVHGRKLRYDVYSSIIQKSVNCSKSKEKKIVEDFKSTPLTELSYDEFDLMVMGKNKNLANSQHSSTPTGAQQKSIATKRASRISELKSVKKIKNTIEPRVEVSSFFGSITLDGDDDLFEKFVDFKNMPDEFVDVKESQETNKNNFEIEVQEDTFNLTSYVPVGDNLRRKLSDA